MAETKQEPRARLLIIVMSGEVSSNAAEPMLWSPGSPAMSQQLSCGCLGRHAARLQARQPLSMGVSSLCTCMHSQSPAVTTQLVAAAGPARVLTLADCS